MKKSIKRIAVMIFTTGIILSSTFTSLAAWEQSEAGWKYKDDTTNVYYLNGWYWIDGNSDNVAECYYFNNTGIMSANTVVDNYTINADGQWIVDGVVQTKTLNDNSVEQGDQNNSNKGKIWDGNGVDEVGGSFGIDPELMEKIKNSTFY